MNASSFNTLPIACTSAFCAMIASTTAWSEGARIEMDCTATKNCDAAGTCLPQDSKTHFTLSPVKANADLTGTYSIAYKDVETTATIDTGFAVTWTTDATNHIIPLSETQQIWITSRITQPGDSDITFQTCQVTF